MRMMINYIKFVREILKRDNKRDEVVVNLTRQEKREWLSQIIQHWKQAEIYGVDSLVNLDENARKQFGWSLEYFKLINSLNIAEDLLAFIFNRGNLINLRSHLLSNQVTEQDLTKLKWLQDFSNNLQPRIRDHFFLYKRRESSFGVPRRTTYETLVIKQDIDPRKVAIDLNLTVQSFYDKRPWLLNHKRKVDSKPINDFIPESYINNDP
jgi:hypothetical protein